MANELLCGRNAPPNIQNGIAAAKAFYRSLPDFAPYLEQYQRVDVATLQTLTKDEIRGSGYVLHTLEAALWCLLHHADYRSCLLEAVNLGEDTDTVGAVAGGLAGIQYGLAGIPAEWLEVIAKRAEIEELCRLFAQNG